MLGAALSFSAMAALTHGLREKCDWHVIALARTLLAFFFAALLATSAGVRPVVFRPMTLWLRSIAGSVSLVLTFFALTHLNVADALTLTNMFPVWVALLSWPMLGRAPSPGLWLAVGCGMAGVALIQQPHFKDGNLATLAAIGASFTTALAMMGLHRLRHIDSRAIVVHFSAVASVAAAAAVYLDHDRLPLAALVAPTTIAMLLGVGASATVGQILMTRAFALGNPAAVSVVALTQIVFAMALDAWIWQRAFEPVSLAGIALVAAPTAWIVGHGEAAPAPYVETS